MKPHPYDALAIARFVAGELDEAQASSVAAHLEICGRCRAEADMARAHMSVGVGHDFGERSERLRRSFQARLATHSDHALPRRATAPAPPRTRRWAWIAAMAAVLAAVIGLQEIGSHSSPPTPTGELLSHPAERLHAISIDPLPQGWKLHLDSALPDSQAILIVEDPAGRELYRQSSRSQSWSLERSDIPEFDPTQVYFVRILGRDSQGRQWIEGPQLLP